MAPDRLVPCENAPVATPSCSTDDMPAPSYTRYLVRYGLLTLGVALATFGLIGWTDLHFDLRGFWLYDNGWQLHPVHLLIVGIGLVPPAIWEVFVLETARQGRQRRQGPVDVETGDNSAGAKTP